MIIGISVGAISAIVGTMAAIGLVSLAPRRAALTMSALTLPVMLPPLVLAVALLTFFVGVGLKPGLLTVIISHVLFTQPFVILIVHARMANFDFHTVESARDLGASPFTAFLTVTLPIIRPDRHRRRPHRHGAVDRRFRHHLLHHRQRQHPADAASGA